jgi:hypothetical protein
MSFDLSNAFHLIPHSPFLHRLSGFGVSGDYVNWFRSYLSNRKSQVSVSAILSSSSEFLSGVPHGFVLGPLLFNVFINYIHDAVAHSMYLLFADDIKIYRSIKSPDDCNLLRPDINSVQGWCTASYMKLNASKTKVISFPTKTNVLMNDYKLCKTSIKDLSIYIDNKLHFHNHVNHIFLMC